MSEFLEAEDLFMSGGSLPSFDVDVALDLDAAPGHPLLLDDGAPHPLLLGDGGMLDD